MGYKLLEKRGQRIGGAVFSSASTRTNRSATSGKAPS